MVLDPNYLNDIDSSLHHFNEIYPDMGSDRQSLYYSNDEFVSTVNRRDNDMIIFHLNTRSLLNKMGELTSLLSSLSVTIDIICISETWLNESTTSLINIDRYHVFNVYRESRRGGGVSIFVNDAYQSEVLYDISYCQPYIECIFVSCIRYNVKVIVGCIYRPPDANFDQFFEALEELLTLVSQMQVKEIFMCGDYNIDMMNMQNDKSASFLNTMSLYSYYPVITKPSRIENNSYSLLDNIFCKNLNNFTSGLIISALSDHYPVFLLCRNFFQNLKSSQSGNFIKYRSINERTLGALFDSLSEYDFSPVYNILDIDEAFACFERIIMEHYNRFCPIKGRTVSYKDIVKPWIDTECKTAIKRRDNCYRLYKMGKMTRVAYNCIRNRVTLLLRGKKKSYFEGRFEEVKFDIKRTWSLINGIIKPSSKSKRGYIKELNVDGSIISDGLRIANELNDYFVNVGANISRSFMNNISHSQFLTENFSDSFFFAPATNEDIRKYISSLKNKKCSINCLPSSVLKHISSIVEPIMCHLINLSISSGTFPDSLKIARIVPLPKSNNKANISNYRPISILNIFSKIFEKHAYRHLYSFLNAKNILSDCQFGFRQNRGTSQAILQHLNGIYESLDGDEVMFSMYLDFHKAFDSVDHEILLEKLQYYGIRGLPLTWFKSYLTDRKQIVSVNDVISGTGHITHSVPQGSNLGPLLFLIFINDLPKCTNFFKFLMFADDCTITCNFPKNELSFAPDRINNYLMHLNHWLIANKIKMNSSKTKYII